MLPDPLIGKTFGRLTIIENLGIIGKYRRVVCLCTCGNKKAFTFDNLSKHANSCGCLRKELLTKHGMYKAPEYRIWIGIRQRCLNKKQPAYPDYGGRGIKICKRWQKSFTNFYADIGPRPSPKYSVERKDNNGSYNPSNCVWATQSQQNLNRRNTPLITAFGRTQTITEWSWETKLSHKILSYRLSRWPVEKALTLPVQRRLRRERKAISAV